MSNKNIVLSTIILMMILVISCSQNGGQNEGTETDENPKDSTEERYQQEDGRI